LPILHRSATVKRQLASEGPECASTLFQAKELKELTIHTTCRFLERDQINNEEEAVKWSVLAAIQRNKVYSCDTDHEYFRQEWRKELRKESKQYRQREDSMSDSEHCKIIGGIADRLSAKFAHLLNGERLRFGTSQKALNLYLKYFWHFGEVSVPPHCPFDSIVLGELKIWDAWTKSDDAEAYMRWVNTARREAGTISISEWECAAWLRNV
jgi:hypothetical protein